MRWDVNSVCKKWFLWNTVFWYSLTWILDSFLVWVLLIRAYWWPRESVWHSDWTIWWFIFLPFWLRSHSLITLQSWDWWNWLLKFLWTFTCIVSCIFNLLKFNCNWCKKKFLCWILWLSLTSVFDNLWLWVGLWRANWLCWSRGWCNHFTSWLINLVDVRLSSDTLILLHCRDRRNWLWLLFGWGTIIRGDIDELDFDISWLLSHGLSLKLFLSLQFLFPGRVSLIKDLALHFTNNFMSSFIV